MSDNNLSKAIALGERIFEVLPLKLGQLRGLFDALENMTGKSGGALVEAAVKVVHAGLARAHPDLTLDTLLEIPATIGQINTAVSAVTHVAGLVAQPAVPGANTGEAGPVATPSPTSTAPSPPAAATPTA